MKLHLGVVSIFLLFFIGVTALGADITGAATLSYSSGEIDFAWTFFIAAITMGSIAAMSVWYSNLEE